MRITLEFTGPRSGEAELEVPSSYAGQKNLPDAFTELTVLSDKTTLSDSPTSANKILHFQPGTSVRISYLLVKDWAGQPLNSDTRFRPLLERDHFQLLSDTALIKPKLDPNSIQDVTFDWYKLPQDWSFASSFGVDHRYQSFHGAWKQIRTALFAGGDYRIQRTTLAGSRLIFATRGNWSFTDDEWIEQVRRVIKTERAFWHDNKFPYTLITLTPLDQDGGSYAGSAYTNAFMMHLPRKATLNYVVISTLAHENFHLWNPYKMGGENGRGVTWFTEGFTRYYADLILFRTGFLPLSEYVERVNERLRQYEFSPVKNVTNADYVARYELDPSLNDISGQRGMVIALWLDAQIRQHTRNAASLDSLMFELVRQARNSRFRLSVDGIIDLAGKYLSQSDRQLLRQYVQDGLTIELPEVALTPCVRVRTDSVPQFELGMDWESLVKRYVVSGIKPDSEAFKAGLRDGQKVVRISITKNDVSKPVKLTVRTSDGDHAYEYYPRGPSKQIQQYYLVTPCS